MVYVLIRRAYFNFKNFKFNYAEIDTSFTRKLVSWEAR